MAPTSTSRAYDFAYDTADQIVGATYRTTDTVPSVLKRYGYAYDKVGNRTTEQIDEAPRVWAYNNTNQMISQAGGGALRFEGTVSEPATVTVQGQPALVSATNTFSGAAVVISGTPTVTVKATDGSGNTASQTYEVDVTDAPGSFVYDLNGNLTEHGTKTYEWDAENRLVRVRVSGTEVARFAYDGLGRRAEKVSSGVTREYVYDGEDIAEERAGSTTTRIVHGPGIDQPLAAVTGSTPTYYLADHLGSIAQHTNSSQAVTLTRTYDPFGKLTSGDTASGYAFTGREWDAEIGLYYYRARYYDAGLGRFISADPWGFVDGPNVYAYVTNSPTHYRDPSGRNVWRSLAYAGGATLTLGTGFVLTPALIIGGIAVVVVGGTIATLVYFSGDETTTKAPSNTGSGEVCKAFTPDQEALVELAKKAKAKGGVTEGEAQTLLEWAREVGLNSRGPEAHKNRKYGSNPHIHIGPVNHIPIK